MSTKHQKCVCVCVLCTLVQVWTNEVTVRSSVAMWLCKRKFFPAVRQEEVGLEWGPAYCKMCWPKARGMCYLIRKHIWVRPFSVEKLSPTVTSRLRCWKWLFIVLSTAQMLVQVVESVCSQGWVWVRAFLTSRTKGLSLWGALVVSEFSKMTEWISRALHDGKHSHFFVSSTAWQKQWVNTLMWWVARQLKVTK